MIIFGGSVGFYHWEIPGCYACVGAARAGVAGGGKDCLASFSRIRGSVCRECGVPIDAVSGDQEGDGSGELFEDVCIACRSQKLHFDRARSFARYQGSLVCAIVLLKFEEMEPLADWFADRPDTGGRRDCSSSAAQDSAARAGV